MKILAVSFEFDSFIGCKYFNILSSIDADNILLGHNMTSYLSSYTQMNKVKDLNLQC